MADLRVFTGNQLEALADRLAAVLALPLPSPLTPETLVVPNQALGRWLSLRLAERLGVWANFRLLAPDEFLLGAVRTLVPGAPDSACFSPEVLCWRVLRHLPRIGAPELARYLSDDPAGLKGLQLARKVAETFELYGVFRPDLLQAWEQGAEPNDWQAALWRLLARERPGSHKACQMAELLRLAAEGCLAADGVRGTLPARVSVFGIATLAPVRLRLLTALAGCCEVNLFVVNPSANYWGELVSPRDQARLQREALDRGTSPDDLHLEPGNPLLASLGTLGRDFHEELLETTDGAARTETCFVEPGTATLLTCLQSDILAPRERGTADVPRVTLAAGDRSLQVHSCHSPLREVEVLHDHLLERFAAGDGLRPGDVLVAAPDIEVYAPLVEAVFGGCSDPAQRIPFAVADRGARARSHTVDAFLRLLDLHDSRFGAAQVLDLLECADVRRRFELSDQALELVRGWVGSTRIRWGIDGADRARRGLPGFEENTWRAGLRRLLLGYALPGNDKRLFQGILPYDDVEGGGAGALGALVDFVETLFEHLQELGRPRPLAQWGDTLRGLADRFLAPDEGDERDADALRRELVRLGEVAALAAHDDPVDLRVVRAHLIERLESEGPGGGFLTGRVTFCTLRPLRSVPFRVIAVLGLDDGAFPRSRRPPGFDRLAAAPRRGDPSLRDEDRFLFLELLLSAREHLYLSYGGQSQKDNSTLPPSVVVSELLDAVGQGFSSPDGPLPDCLVTHHRLQAFSPAYFGDGPLYSYSRENCDAVRARAEGPPAERPFFCHPLPEPELKVVELSRLASFLAHPAKFFAVHRLGLRLEGDDDALDEREPFAVVGLDRYLVEQSLAEGFVAGDNIGGEKELLRARGVLPPAAAGDDAFEGLEAQARALAARVRPHLGVGERSSLDIDLSLGAHRLVGRLRGLWPGGLVHFRAANVKGKDRLRAWVEHLALCASSPGETGATLLVGSDLSLRYRHAAPCRERLVELLALYREGHRRPLPLFPASSLDYAVKASDPGAATAAARKSWDGPPYDGGTPGEGKDPYNALCFRGTDPLGGDFARLAVQVFGPLLEHQEKP